MAKSGPKPKPTKIKKLQGNPGKRPLNKKEPKPKQIVKIQSAPRHLDPVAKKEWRRTGKKLIGLGLLTDIDLPAFAAYCQQYSTWVMATEEIKKNGVLSYAKNGFPMQSPFVAIQNKAQVEMRKWLTEFGMTPSSRSRVEVNDEPEKDEFTEYLKSGGPKVVK